MDKRSTEEIVEDSKRHFRKVIKTFPEVKNMSWKYEDKNGKPIIPEAVRYLESKGLINFHNPKQRKDNMKRRTFRYQFGIEAYVDYYDEYEED